MRKQRYKIFVCALLLVTASHFAMAQALNQGQVPGWNLYNCEGEIILTRDGKRTVYQNGSPKPLGILLGAKDMVQTGKGTADLRLMSGDGDINLNLSENTSVIIDSLSGRVSLELLYGRIRIQSSSPLTIQSGNSSSNFRECDAEINYISKPGSSQPSLMISCFSGEGELLANVTLGTEGMRFPIRNAESLSLEYFTPFAYVERKSLDAAPASVPATRVEEPKGALDYSAGMPQPAAFPETTGSSKSISDRARRIKTGSLIAGLIFIGAGAAMQGYSYIANPGKELRDMLFYGGYVPMGLGAILFIGSAVYKDPPNHKN